VNRKAAALPGYLGPQVHRLYEHTVLWLALGLLGVLSLAWSVLAVPLHYLLPRRWSRPLGRWVLTTGFRLYLGALALIGACRLDLRALDDLRTQGALVIAPNHPSLLDALLIVSRLPGLACIMKGDIVANPFLGAGARLAGYIRNDAPLAMVRQALAELKAGGQLLIFPEATRTSRWPIGPLTGAAALIARRAEVPVQTLLIEPDSAYLTKGWPLFRRPDLPIRFRIRLGRRFDPGQEAGDLTAALERYFRAELAHGPQPPLGETRPASAPGRPRHG